MKKLVTSVIFSLTFVFIFFFFPKSSLAQGARGTCWCTGPFNQPCNNIILDNCSPNFTPVCNTTAPVCQAGDKGCTCILASEKPCDGPGEPCCEYGRKCEPGLTCWAGLCGGALLPTGIYIYATPTPGPITPGPTVPIRPGIDPWCPDGPGYVNTAIGCIPVSDINKFIGFLLRFAIGVGGGLSFLLIIISGIQILSSSGYPERLETGKKLLAAAVSGLLLIIFAVFLLEVIGVRILRLPGF